MKQTKKNTAKNQYRSRIKSKTNCNKVSNYNPEYVIIEKDNVNKRLDTTLLCKYLKSYGLHEGNKVTAYKKPLVFVWYIYDETGSIALRRKYYNTKILIHNTLDNFLLCLRKDNLYFTMRANYPNEVHNFMAPSFYLTLETKLDEGKVYIARPINIKSDDGVMVASSGGKGVIIIHDTASLQQAKNNLVKYDNILVSEYISNPYLINNRKCHIRVHFMIYIDNKNILRSYILNDHHFIITAKLPYKNDDYENAGIHDTHKSSTDVDSYFPRDLVNVSESDKKRLNVDIGEIVKKISYIVAPNIKVYENNCHGFNIFGADVLLTDDLQLILMEVNSRPGFTRIDKSNKRLEKSLFGLINDVILLPVLGNSDKNKVKRQYNMHSKDSIPVVKIQLS